MKTPTTASQLKALRALVVRCLDEVAALRSSESQRSTALAQIAFQLDDLNRRAVRFGERLPVLTDEATVRRAHELAREAKRRGITLSALVRERMDAASTPGRVTDFHVTPLREPS